MTIFVRVVLLAALSCGMIACAESVQYGPVDPPDQFGAFGVGYTSFTAVDAD